MKQLKDLPAVDTCDRLADQWTLRWPRADPISNDRHRAAVKRFSEHFRFRALDSITPEEARHFAEGQPGTVRYLITMFNDAIGDGLLPEDSNPFVGLRIQAKVKKIPAKVPTISELHALEGAADELGSSLRTAIIFSAYTGVRRGECRAFGLDDLGGIEHRVGAVVPERARIDWQITNDGRIKEPKKEGRRGILLPPRARNAVADRMCELGNEKGRLRIECSRSRIRSWRLWPLPPRTWDEEWKAIRETADVHIRWHDLRHYAATWFLDNDATVHDVAVQLGCRPFEVERTYGHPDPDKALGRLAALVGT